MARRRRRPPLPGRCSSSSSAQLCLGRGDYEHARALAEAVLVDATESPRATGQILFHGRIALAQALVGLARFQEARGVLAEVGATSGRRTA